MTQDRATAKSTNTAKQHANRRIANSYYGLLGLHPSASVIEIRRAYRELSKRYHPDTTDLPVAIAKTKFQELNEAYATLSNPQRRMLYDQKLGYARVYVIQPPPELQTYRTPTRTSSSAYLDPVDRPLSSGEIFALFILGLTFLACLLLAIAIGLTQGEAAFQVPQVPSEQGLNQLQSVTPPTQGLAFSQAVRPQPIPPAFLEWLQAPEI